MKNLSLVFGTLLVIGTNSLPQYGQPQAHSVQVRPPPFRNPGPEDDLPEGCRYENKLVQTIVEVETERKVCNPYKDRICDTKYRQACNPYQKEECRTVYKQECNTRYRYQCETKYRTELEEYEEDECKKTYKRVCEATWVVDNYGDKVWQDDPNNCKQLPEDDCKPVKKTRTKNVEYQDCRDVPKMDCKDVPKRECAYVTKTKCERQAYEDCYDVTKQNCETVHSKVPQTLNGQKRIRVCDHDNGQVYNNNAQPDFDYADQVEIIDAVIRENDIQEEGEENTTDKYHIDSFDNLDSGLVFSD